MARNKMEQAFMTVASQNQVVDTGIHTMRLQRGCMHAAAILALADQTNIQGQPPRLLSHQIIKNDTDPLRLPFRQALDEQDRG